MDVNSNENSRYIGPRSNQNLVGLPSHVPNCPRWTLYARKLELRKESPVGRLKTAAEELAALPTGVEAATPPEDDPFPADVPPTMDAMKVAAVVTSLP